VLPGLGGQCLPGFADQRRSSAVSGAPPAAPRLLWLLAGPQRDFEGTA
jgi:hypothetical protein